eukprot:g19986.t1
MAGCVGSNREQQVRSRQRAAAVAAEEVGIAAGGYECSEVGTYYLPYLQRDVVSGFQSQCTQCNRPVHALGSCSDPQGEEGYGQPRLCFPCEGKVVPCKACNVMTRAQNPSEKCMNCSAWVHPLASCSFLTCDYNGCQGVLQGAEPMTCVKCKTTKSENRSARICDACKQVRLEEDAQEEVHKKTYTDEWLHKMRTSYRATNDSIPSLWNIGNRNCCACNNPVPDRVLFAVEQCSVCSRVVHQTCTSLASGISPWCDELGVCIKSWDQGRVRSSCENYQNQTEYEVIDTSFQALCGLPIMNAMPRVLDIFQAEKEWSEAHQELRPSVEVKKVSEKGYRGSDMGDGLFAAAKKASKALVALGTKGSLHHKECRIVQDRISNMTTSNPGAYRIEVLYPDPKT